MSKMICLILGGGRGSRLFPLTSGRSKPAVPIAGKYRLIDIPIANCIHSGFNRIFVLTQFNSVSLHRHISNTYKFDSFGGGFVEILAAQQTQQHESWYQGTADAVRRNIPSFIEGDYDYVLILSGDQLYRMDFQEMLQTHKSSNAAVTIATLPVPRKEATACGIMRVNEAGRVTDFHEKPKTADALERVQTSQSSLERLGFSDPDRPFLASMGIYLFNRSTLIDLLATGNATDFGKELFPQTIQSHHVQAHLFDGYWEDIGTVGAFHRANIELAGESPPFDFMIGDKPIFTRPRYLPCSRLNGVTVRNSIIADGCVIGANAIIENSVIGVRAVIGDNVVIRNSYVMGADTFEPRHLREANAKTGHPDAGIGCGSHIKNAIIDKNARIGRNVRLVNESGATEADGPPAFIRDGIIVIPRSTVLNDNFTL